MYDCAAANWRSGHWSFRFVSFRWVEALVWHLLVVGESQSHFSQNLCERENNFDTFLGETIKRDL